jgi:hypothetical protein
VGSSHASSSSSESSEEEAAETGSVLELLARARGDVGAALRTPAQSARTAGNHKRKTGKLTYIIRTIG